MTKHNTKLFRTFLMLLLLPVCAACTVREPTQETEPPAADIAVTPDQPQEEMSLDNEELYIPLPQQYEIAECAPLRQYAPDIQVTPVLNEARYYSYCIIGELNFIRQDHSLVNLPDRVSGFSYIMDDYSGDLVGFSLYRDGKCALMDTAGNMATDFLYTPVEGIEDDIFPSRSGYVVLGREDTAEQVRFGLVDIASGQETIPMQYQNLEPFSNSFLARTGEAYLLLDYLGNVLYDFGPHRPDYDAYFGSHTTIDAEHILLFHDETNVTLLAEPNDFSDENLEVITDIHCLGQFIIVNHRYRATERKGESALLSLYQGNQHLLSLEYKKLFQSDAKYFIIAENGDVYILFSEGNYQVIPVPDLMNQSNTIYKMTFTDNMLSVSYNLINDQYNFEFETVTYNTAGVEISRERTYRQTNYQDITVSQNENRQLRLENKNGEVLIPFSVYDDFLYQTKSFVVGGDWLGEESGEGRYMDILNLQGQVLLQDVLDYEAVFDDRLLVWLNEQDCVFLYPDGKTEPIKNLPPVKLRYFGG